eukprot:GFKZ01013444.1.p1 GENE.GFKZ01013444.1~~GFKZ01013444.1.p1  ORF type:complete len:228 (-),score=17.79 GFKZ01013444.1:653-1336(-)
MPSSQLPSSSSNPPPSARKPSHAHAHHTTPPSQPTCLHPQENSPATKNKLTLLSTSPQREVQLTTPPNPPPTNPTADIQTKQTPFRIRTAAIAPHHTSFIPSPKTSSPKTPHLPPRTCNPLPTTHHPHAPPAPSPLNSHPTHHRPEPEHHRTNAPPAPPPLSQTLHARPSTTTQRAHPPRPHPSCPTDLPQPPVPSPTQQPNTPPYTHPYPHLTFRPTSHRPYCTNA